VQFIALSFENVLQKFGTNWYLQPPQLDTHYSLILENNSKITRFKNVTKLISMTI